MVAERGAGGISQGHARGGLVGDMAKSETVGHPSRSDREQPGKVVRETGDVQVGGVTHGREVLAGELWQEGVKRRGEGLSISVGYITISNGA